MTAYVVLIADEHGDRVAWHVVAPEVEAKDAADAVRQVAANDNDAAGERVWLAIPLSAWSRGQFRATVATERKVTLR